MTRQLQQTGHRAAAGLTAACLLAMILITGCEQAESEWIQGYAEGEFVHVASPRAGRVVTLHVHRGRQVQTGQPLFELDSDPEQAARDEARQRLQQATATLDDLRQGQRPSEIAAIDAQLSEAKAALDFATRELERLEKLRPGGGASVFELDHARATRDQAQARVKQFEARLQTAELGARDDQIAAAQSEVAARQAALELAEWNLSQKQVVAPADGLVFDTLFRPGEQVPANQPVVTLLPPTNIMVRTFIPQVQLGEIKLGDTATVRADGLAGSLTGKVAFISPRVEYTPPIIYSQESRDKLVFMIEIRFAPDDAAQLQPGQPVDVNFQSSAGETSDELR